MTTASSPISEDVRVGTLVNVKPSIYVGAAAMALPSTAEKLVERVVVDCHQHLPDMFEITFFDNQGSAVTTAGLSIGTAVEVWAGSPATSTAIQLIGGEVTAIEGLYGSGINYTVVRGYSKDHRLQRARRNRTFLNMKDSDIARQVASDAGLTVGTIDETKATHDHVGQVNQTDWDFLTWRAASIGYEIGITQGKFYFRKASSASSTTGGAPIPLTFPTNLRSFTPRVTAGNLAQEAEVRVWDPLAAKVVISKQATATGSVQLSKASPASIVGQFAGTTTPPAPEENNAALGDLGPAPTDMGFVSSNQPLAVGSAISPAADEVVAGILEQTSSSFAEAEGEAVGDPHLVAGAVVTIAGVPDPFAGEWVISGARHEFAAYYHTIFEVSGRHTRSLLGLTSGDLPPPAQVEGVACGIVSNINDPQSKGRVKVVLPWLSPTFESDWGSVVQFGAGKRAGGMFLPEVGDEVLVAFEFGDPRRPFVLGGIVNNNTTYTLGGSAVQAQGETASVIRRGIVAASGNMLAFHDEIPPGDDAKPTASTFALGTSDGSVGFVVDVVQGQLNISCAGMDDAPGTLTIKCNDAGQINIQAGEGGTVTVDGGGQLNLKAQEMINISCQGEVQIQGEVVKLN